MRHVLMAVAMLFAGVMVTSTTAGILQGRALTAAVVTPGTLADLAYERSLWSSGRPPCKVADQDRSAHHHDRVCVVPAAVDY
jgi:hypothetical protein